MTTPETDGPEQLPPADGRKLVLSDVLNRVLDKGMVLSGNITIAVADIDLIQLDLSLLLAAVETAIQRQFPNDPNMPGLPGPEGEPPQGS